jgi:OmpA-OmpF porin, OOP family
MIQIVRAAAVTGAAALIGAALAGCGGSHPQSTGLPACLAPAEPVALAIGARSNSPMPELTAGVTTAINSAIHAHRAVSIIRLDGSPRVVFSQPFTPAGSNTQTRQVSFNKYVATVNQVLQGTSQAATDIRAQAPQADMLGALAEAAGEVPRGGNIIVMDSGLQTSAPLNFRTGLLDDDPQSITEFLRKSGELPSLAGRHVYFSGLGWTASPQPQLGIRNRNKLIQIWKELATAAGASCVAADRAPDTQSAVPDRPRVGIVTPPPPPRLPRPCRPIDLNEANNVGFDYDSTTFRTPAGARVTLRQLTNVMVRTGESVILTGATSSEGSNQYNLALSLRRANAVRAVLIQQGVLAGRITTRGVGSHLPGRLNDRSPDGQLLIGPAIQNRKVVARLAGAGCRRG